MNNKNKYLNVNIFLYLKKFLKFLVSKILQKLTFPSATVYMRVEFIKYLNLYNRESDF